MDERLAYMDRMERKEKEEVERRRKMKGNLFYRLACVAGLL